MATDDEAKAAGFTMPSGTSPINGGDDAIRTNSRVTLDLVNDARFIKPFAGTGGNLDTFTTPGLHGYWTDIANNPDPTTSGNVLVLPGPNGSTTTVTQIAYPYGLASTQWKRFKGTTGFSAWVRMDAGAVPDAPAPSGQGPAQLRTVPLALTLGGSPATTDTTGSVRLPVRVGARITRYRVHITNVNPRVGTLGGTRNIAGVWVGPATSDGQVSALSRIGAAQVSTTTYVSGWTSAPLEPHTDYLVGFGYSGTGPVETNVGGAWTAPDSGAASSPSSTGWTRAVKVPFDVWIEAETDATTPVIAGFGDSLTAGVGATVPVHDSWLSQWARARGALPVHYAASGDTMLGWSNTGAYKWQRWQNLSRPDAVVHAMGGNDLFGNANLTTMQARRAVSIEQLRTLVSPTIVSATIPPRTTVTGAAEDTRRAYNAWLASMPDAARDVFGFAAAVSSDDETLDPALDADGVHLTTVGYGALAASITRPLVSTGMRDRLDALEYDSGWRNVSALLEPGIGGNVFISREGKTVHMLFHNVTTTTAGTVDIYQLPPGFRPTAVSGANWRNGTLATDNGDTVRQASFFNNRMRILNMPTGKQLGGYLIFRVPPALPTTIPGTPA